MRNIRRPYAKVCARHEEEFRFRENRDQNILLKIRREGKCVILSTYSRKHGNRGRFFVLHDPMFAWAINHPADFYDADCGNLMRVAYRAGKTLRFDFWWLSEGLNGGISGIHQDFEVDRAAFCAAMESPETTRILCKETSEPTTFVWTLSAQQNLRGISHDKLYRRALCKAFAKGCLRWPGETITMYADGGRDFYFRASSGIDGGLICSHGTTRNGYPKLTYQSHT